MTIVCAATPEFLYALHAQHHDEWAAKPIALLGLDGRVWATSPSAAASGVIAGLTQRQARARCPDVWIDALDTPTAEAAQSAFVSVLNATGMPVETQGFGVAYCDLSAVATSPLDAKPIGADLGARIRRELGAALTPALGIDHSKFTARAAAQLSQPGRMRLVTQDEEERFLTPQPLTLLPLPLEHLRQLHWLGLRTLGDFARLPAASVRARFGAAGVLAHTWARGKDNRPVRADAHAALDPAQIDFETPCVSVDQAVADASHALVAPLRALSERLEGCRRLLIEQRFLDGGASACTQALVAPTCQVDDLRAALKRALTNTAWPAELIVLRIRLLDIAELAPRILTLFGEAFDMSADVGETAPFATITRKLGIKHSGAFFQADVDDLAHPVAERRARWVQL